MESKVKDITKPHLKNIIRRDGDGEVKGKLIDVILGKNSVNEAIEKCRKNLE